MVNGNKIIPLLCYNVYYVKIKLYYGEVYDYQNIALCLRLLSCLICLAKWAEAFVHFRSCFDLVLKMYTGELSLQEFLIPRLTNSLDSSDTKHHSLQWLLVK